MVKNDILARSGDDEIREDAIVILQRVRATDPEFTFVDLDLARALTFAGRLDEAMALSNERETQARARNRDLSGTRYRSAFAYVRCRPPRRGRTAIGQDQFPYRQAVIYAALGDTDSTFDRVGSRRGAAAGACRGLVDGARTGRLRDDPRYGAVRKRLNLP